ncbi:MAG: hypothetical protein DWQ36_13860 [Acidobacteria bacterium]|nr:MAG: hypothetical protein DWQ30_20095 [Acidobacteriota bacterium]REK06293.1 MAG: hypothetical protein DWQ36_13860 [Acidobacteriota bacterium]
MHFEIVGEIRSIDLIATGRSIRELERLVEAYGPGRWRKLKGIADIRVSGEACVAEIHWYEAHGVGRREFKIKRILD